MREIARKMSQEEFDEIARIWLAGVEAAEEDRGTRDFFNGTFGPWASELLRQRRSWLYPLGVAPTDRPCPRAAQSPHLRAVLASRVEQDIAAQ